MSHYINKRQLILLLKINGIFWYMRKLKESTQKCISNCMKKIYSGHTRIWIFIYQIQLSISQEYYLVLLIYKKIVTFPQSCISKPSIYLAIGNLSDKPDHSIKTR